MKKSVIIIANDAGYTLSPIPIDIEDENKIKIFRKAMDIIKTVKGFIRFFQWLRPECTYNERTLLWQIDDGEWVKSMDVVYIKNARSYPFKFVITRRKLEGEDGGAMKKLDLVLKPGGWVEITDDKITVLDSFIIAHEEDHKTTFKKEDGGAAG